MSKLADIAFQKIEQLEQNLIAAKTALVEREAQLTKAIRALEDAKEHIGSGNTAAVEQITANALARLSSGAALLEETRARVRRETAQQCVELIYPDGNPEIAIRRIKQDFGLCG